MINKSKLRFSESMQKRILLFITLFIVLGAAATFLFYYLAMNIPVEYSFKNDNSEPNNNGKKEVVYFGVISRYPPNIIFKGYQPIMDYLTQETKYRFELKLSASYQETLKQLAKGEVAAAFFGSYLYTKAHDIEGIVPILKPLNENKEPFFRSVLITRSDSKINSINDLSGAKIALPSKESFSGNWLTNFELKKDRIPISKLEKVQNFAHHHSVIYQVLKGNFEAGVVKEVIAKKFLGRGLKIIAYSDEVPGSPIVVPRNFNPEITREIKKAFLKINTSDKYYIELLKNWDAEFIYGFVEAKDSDYNSIREMTRDGAAL